MRPRLRNLASLSAWKQDRHGVTSQTVRRTSRTVMLLVITSPIEFCRMKDNYFRTVAIAQSLPVYTDRLDDKGSDPIHSNKELTPAEYHLISDFEQKL